MKRNLNAKDCFFCSEMFENVPDIIQIPSENHFKEKIATLYAKKCNIKKKYYLQMITDKN